MSNDGYTLVLTTSEYSWWPSMQEILPAIERVWTRIGRSGRENIRVLRVPMHPPEKEQSLPISTSGLNRIVVTAATAATVEITLLLRERMRASAPIIIYVHGDATTGFHAFGALGNALTESDTLVVSCGAEAVAARISFPKARICVIPFPLVDGFKLSGGEPHGERRTTRLAYVGRVSEQKNLHTLLFALWILRTVFDHAPMFTLDVYGGVDDHGSPNMDLHYAGYDGFLHDLTESLELDQVVRWHGAQTRDWVFDHVHLRPHILVSPTLHADENFGASVLASLVNGHQVVTTAWGGHLGFEKWFPQQLRLVPVHGSTLGPFVHPVSLASAILRAIEESSTMRVDKAALNQARAEFSGRRATVRTLEMLGRRDPEPVALAKSLTQRCIDDRRASYGGTRKIYSGYADPLAQIFFEAYGMDEPLTFGEGRSYILSPWTSYSHRVLRVVDPHRGIQSFGLGGINSNPMDVRMCPTDTCRLPQGLVRTLVGQGTAVQLP